MMNDYDAARSALLEALRLCGELNNRRGTPFALEYMGMLVAAEGRPEQAITLYGAAHGLRERSDLSLPISEVQTMQEAYEATRGQVGQATFEAQFERGRTFTLEQAVDFALTIYPAS